MSADERKRSKPLLWVVGLTITIAVMACHPFIRDLIRRECGIPRETIPGTEEVYTGLVSDRAMGIVDWLTFDKAPFLAENRPYIGVAFEDGGGECFWLADLCEETEPAYRGDRVRVETAVEKETGFRVATRIALLKKDSEKHEDPRYQ